ncbi:NACHT domain-containing protein [Chitinophaga filiformis]|uniref:NACHT domain-containing protein n=1 Tax=Chitinophaga filiformis TaxID=104663 RepID=A0ABY4I990_CHIFI|nr:NACHT domain-containing protein [Chitinophaga filiformis]UPK72135.1 hypothetical protein MYF79_12650 [Chitinophaga filiformis]
MERKDIISILKSPFERLLNLIGEEFRQAFANRIFEYQIEQFERNFLVKTLLHNGEPVMLSKIYEPLTIKKMSSRDSCHSIAITLYSAKQYFETYSSSTIFGYAGSGKSFIVKHLFTKCILEEYKIPIKIELRYLNEYENSLTDYMFKEVFHNNKLGTSHDIIDRMLSKNHFVFMFDGFDEVKQSKKSKTLHEIEIFTGRYNQNIFLITSRFYTGIELLPRYVNFEVCPFGNRNIVSFIKKQNFDINNEITNKLIEVVNAQSDGMYSTFLSNPLLLSMFILTYRFQAEIPERRSEYYRQVFEALYSVHDTTSKHAFIREKVSGLTKEQIKSVLKHLCYISFFEAKYLFGEDYLDGMLSLIKKKNALLSFDNEKLVIDLLIGIGMITLDGIEYTFPHRSLQEYFASKHVTEFMPENKERFYEKLLEVVRNNQESLARFDHFLVLLLEMDTLCMYKYFLVPLFESTYLTLNSHVQSMSYSSMHDHINGFIVGVIDLLSSDLNFSTMYGSLDHFAANINRNQAADFFLQVGQDLINKLKKVLSDMSQNQSDFIEFV